MWPSNIQLSTSFPTPNAPPATSHQSRNYPYQQMSNRWQPASAIDLDASHPTNQ
jgi:hypothetical protein